MGAGHGHKKSNDKTPKQEKQDHRRNEVDSLTPKENRDKGDKSSEKRTPESPPPGPAKHKLHMCTNCNKEFDPTQNTESSCRYHNGKKEISNGKGAVPKWSCCHEPDLDSAVSHKIEVAVVGIKGVGKSSVITRIVLNDWLDDRVGANDTSMVSLYAVTVNSVSFNFEFIEFPHPLTEDFQLAEQSRAFHDAHVVLLICQFDNLESLLQLSDIDEKIRNAKGGSPYPVVLVCNKSDTATEARTITGKDIQAQSFGKYFVEFSSKTGAGVDDLIDLMFNQADQFHLFNNGCQTGKHDKKKK